MRIRLPALLITLSLALAACHGGTSSLPSVSQQNPTQPTSTGNLAFSCGAVPLGYSRCYAIRRTDIQPITSLETMHAMTVQNLGYGPAQLRSAYNLNTQGSSTQKVAIVDAFDDPNAETDLAKYRSTFGLGPCTTANGCFKKVNQNGGTTPPAPDSGWAEEISLDIDMVSAVCPKCHILLVETNDNGNANLAAGVKRAAAMGAQVISNSYGGGENGTVNAAAYNQPGHVITASAGDDGYGVGQPASYSTVVAVGGTKLVPWFNVRGWTETAWSCNSAFMCNGQNAGATGGTGSGCSAVIAKPLWQTDKGCTKRSEADIAAVADPNTGVFVYDSYQVTAGFYIFGGTSVSSPVIASMYALAGNAATIASGNSNGAPKRIWTSHSASNVNDVISGVNAPSPVGNCLTAWTYICKARAGYDGLTGWGTPKGLGVL